MMAMETVLAKLDMKTIKLSGFQDLLKVRAAEAKPPFPTRHDWDSFFRENKNMNELRTEKIFGTTTFKIFLPTLDNTRKKMLFQIYIEEFVLKPTNSLSIKIV